MKKFILINYEFKFSSICDNEKEVFEGCGYEEEYENGMNFKDLLEAVKGSYEVIAFTGTIEFLND